MLGNALVEGIATGAAVLFLAAGIGLFGWLAGGGTSVLSEGAVILRYDRKFRGLGLLAIALATASAALFLGSVLGVGVRHEDRPTLIIAAVMFGGLGFPMVVEAYRRQVVMDDSGLVSRGWFGWSKPIGWADIQQVENRVSGGEFVVRGPAGRIRLGHYFDGLDLFRGECMRRLQPEIYGDAFEKPLNRML